VSVEREIRFREPMPGDERAAAELLGQLGYPAPPGSVDRRLARLEHDPASSVLVAVDGDRVVGLAAFHVIPHVELDQPTGRLTSLVVAEDARRRGIGRALVERVAEQARAAGCGRLELMSGDGRTEAHEFYRRLGFADFSRRFVRELGC
jgi:GNAT superfamily N-acetyltransferase